MSNDDTARGTTEIPRSWNVALARYRQPDNRRGALEILVSTLPFVALWAVAALLVTNGYWWAGPVLAVPAAGLLVRMFMLQHDCGHGSLFSRRALNDWVGRAIGVLTFTPYDYWRRTHAVHHATAGNLDQRGIGDVDTLTVAEYRARSRTGAAALLAVPASAGDVRPRAGLAVHLPVPIACRPDAWRLGAVDLDAGHECLHRRHGRPADLACRPRPVPAGPGPDHPDRGHGGRVAVLYPAPVRGDPLVRRPGVEPPERRPARQLAL